MDRDTAVVRIQEKFGFRSDLVTTIQNALQDMQDELERGATLPEFLLQEDQTFTIVPPNPAVATPQEYALPTGFIKEADELDGGQLRFQQTAPGPSLYVEKMDLKEAELRFFSRTDVFWDDSVEIVSPTTTFTPGTPMVYVLRKSTVRIYPGPDKTYNLVWSWYKHALALTGANVTNNEWLTNTPWLLIGKTGLHMAMSLRDADAITYFQKMYDDASKTGLARLIERERADRSYAMGSHL